MVFSFMHMIYLINEDNNVSVDRHIKENIDQKKFINASR